MSASAQRIDASPAAAVARTARELSYGLLPQVLGYHLRRTQVAIFRHFSRTVAAEADITPGLLGMLQVIAANPGLAQSRLAEAMEVDRSTIVKVVDQLQARGLIVRDPSPHDKRSYCLRLTESGIRELRHMQELMLQHEDDFTQPLSAEERELLIRLLERLYSRAEDAPHAAAPKQAPRGRR